MSQQGVIVQGGARNKSPVSSEHVRKPLHKGQWETYLHAHNCVEGTELVQGRRWHG